MDLTIVGCGYVGLALAERLQARRPQLRLTLTTTSSERLEQLSPLADRVQICDATDPTQLLDALRQSSSAVFCLGPKGDRQVDANGYRHTFVDSFRCLTSLLPQLPELRQINYTGSCSVYGDTEGDWVDEQTPPEPSRGHGDVLLEGEQLLKGISDRRVCILRLGALYGPGRDLDRRLRGLAGLERPGSGATYSNWLHVADAAGALEAALDAEWAGVVNVVNDEPIRLRDLVGRSLQRQGLAPVRWLGQDGSGSGGRRIRNTRLKQLGYQLQHPSLDQSGVFAASQVP
ncbi:NAD-dependent epimerase/dehydratase family protein [Synechococcus sp. MU1643]|uniref:NAD-dependent epimerase/dehydratase family protein n=1 Tax=Synechococcus sp. MU1643 TaxID=2508349 RepID=UPI001CF85120|nr:NAD-dependent epimerase/dehydratase family protein [Synechococcus sp. MU1643]MCB4428116.1 NAD-dependent epimerase/dehydratase family protein [Synechococcus sp. MU1643]